MALAARCNPLAHERRFAEASRGRKQGELMFKSFIKPGKQRLA
jgi:hypothetical protein